MLLHIPKVIRFLLNRMLQKSESYYGLNRLDQKLTMYLPWWSGVFVEVGANDGVTQSNTCYFERSRNWKGILIEPIPEIAELCKKNRPHSIVEQCALVGASYSETTVPMHYCNLMSIVDGSKKTHAEQVDHLKRGADCQNVQTYGLTVPAITLSTLLDKHNIKKIDFMSLDVEGYEPEVLSGIDFSRHKPLYLLVEKGSRSEVKTILEPHYEPITILSCIHDDVLYRSKEPIGLEKK